MQVIPVTFRGRHNNQPKQIQRHPGNPICNIINRIEATKNKMRHREQKLIMLKARSQYVPQANGTLA